MFIIKVTKTPKPTIFEPRGGAPITDSFAGETLKEAVQKYYWALANFDVTKFEPYYLADVIDTSAATA